MSNLYPQISSSCSANNQLLPFRSPSAFNNLSNIRNIVTVRLTRENYLIWKTQLIAYLRGQGLFQYVDGTHVCPASNSACITCIQQDQIILSTLLSTLSDASFPHIIGVRTSSELWNKLKRSHISHSRENLTEKINKLSSLKKGNMSLYEYYGKLNLLAAELAEIGEPVSESNLIAFFLNGLDRSYDAVIVYINAQVEPLSLDAVYNLVAHAEKRIQDLPEKQVAIVKKLVKNENNIRDVASPLAVAAMLFGILLINR